MARSKKQDAPGSLGRIFHDVKTRLQALSLTPRFSGVSRRSSDPNRFSGFSRPVKTAEAVQALRRREITPLKQGVNERTTIQGRATHEGSGANLVAKKIAEQSTQRYRRFQYDWLMRTNTPGTSTLLRPLLLATVLLGLGPPASPAGEEAPTLFNGQELAGWRKPTGNWTVVKSVSLDPANPEKLALTPGAGVLINGTDGRTVDLITEAEFGDMEAHVEFCISKHSNSGVYLMGRYEIQIYDSYGVAEDQYPGIECGGIYPRWIGEKNVEGHSPSVNASKPPGEWQTFDITFRAPRFDANGKKTANAKVVKVVHNGKVIHENIELTGPTRGGLGEDEKPTGPLRLQGDHGPVAFRNLRVQPLELK